MDVFEQWGRALLRLASVEISFGTTGIRQMGPFLFFFSAQKFLDTSCIRKGDLRRIFASEVRILAHIQ